MIIARESEIKRLKALVASPRSEFVAVYGRRRVGKTFLIREAFDYEFTFQHAGIANQPKASQIFSFCSSLKEYGLRNTNEPKNWIEAFELLKDLIRKSRRRKKVIFFDELSWMYTPGCDLIAALEAFWNGWASSRKDIVLVVCASATSWMTKNVVHARGGLHHRLTEEINLQPFDLRECGLFVDAFQLPLSREQIIEAYMLLGGIPYYWSLMDKRFSLPQNIDRMFFYKDAPLKGEYAYLFASLFDSPQPYMRIIEILASNKLGMTHEEIQAKYPSEIGGKMSMILSNLESCGFIRSYKPFGKKKKGKLYQLIDCFTLFHFKFIASGPTDEHFWSHKYTTVNAWRGLAFERVCLWHVPQIKRALGISGILTEICSWQCATDKEKGIEGAQIDLLIDRSDKVVTICEMKYCDDEYTLSKKDESALRQKLSSFRKSTATHKGLQLALVTPVGVTTNAHSAIINSAVTADDLFAEAE